MSKVHANDKSLSTSSGSAATQLIINEL